MVRSATPGKGQENGTEGVRGLERESMNAGGETAWPRALKAALSASSR
jgi:hypothetical protein